MQNILANGHSKDLPYLQPVASSKRLGSVIGKTHPLSAPSSPTYEHLTFQHQKRLPASQRIDGPAAGTITVRQQASDSLIGYAMQRPTTQSYAAAPFHATQRHPLQLVYARHAIKREACQVQCQGRRRTSADLDASVCANTVGLNRDIGGVQPARHNRQG